MATIRVTFYGNCTITSRKVVLENLEYQYEGTEIAINGELYDVYSNDDGDYFAVKENE